LSPESGKGAYERPFLFGLESWLTRSAEVRAEILRSIKPRLRLVKSRLHLIKPHLRLRASRTFGAGCRREIDHVCNGKKRGPGVNRPKALSIDVNCAVVSRLESDV